MKKHVTLFSSVLMMSTTLLGAGGVFAESVNPDPATAQTPVTTQLVVEDTKPVTPPTEPGEGGGDQGTNINGLFGIAYTPSTLSGQATLNNSGEQKISLSNNTATKYNVGVKDKTRKKDQDWSLKATLTWTDDTNNYMQGTKIEATGGNVKENIDGNLTTLRNNEVTTDAAKLSIGSSETVVMKSVKGQTMNGTYNYQFEDPKLVIPEVSEVSAGNYQGNINWNLVNTPA